jgi:uncharacterized membrane protein YebE (DUF533 family)
LLIKAMVAAAGSDGHIDDQERQRIFDRVATLNLPSREKALLFDEFMTPASIEQIAHQVPDPVTAAEVYAASLLAVDHGTPQARHYLQALADRLRLPAALVSSMHQQQDVPASFQAA